MSPPPPSPPLQLPNDLSEGNFRRFEQLIADGVNAFPKETEFVVFPGMAPTTFVARFRSAIVSYRNFGWANSPIDPVKLKEISGYFSISRDYKTEKVWFRVKHRAGRPLEAKQALQETGPKIESWDGLTVDELSALCYLIHRGRIRGPVVTNTKFDVTTVNSYEALYNVAIVYDKERNETVIT